MLGIAWHSRGLSDVFSPRPEEPRAFSNRFSARFRAPGVCLCGLQLRWFFLPQRDLDWGLERAALDVIWGMDVIRRAHSLAPVRMP